MKLLIVYGTTEGQTRKIAEFLALEAEKTGAEVTLCDASMEQISPDRYDAVMIGASMHMHRYQTSITHYVKEHMGTLNAIPTALFSVSLSALSEGYDAESFNEYHHALSRRYWMEPYSDRIHGRCSALHTV